MPITIHRAIQPLVDLGVAALKAANNIWTGSNKFTGTVSLSGAEPADTLTLTEKGLWQDYLDVPSTDQVLGAVHFDYAQPSITPAQQAQARTNIGVVTAGGVSLATNGLGTFSQDVTFEGDREIWIQVRPRLSAASRGGYQSVLTRYADGSGNAQFFLMLGGFGTDTVRLDIDNDRSLTGPSIAAGETAWVAITWNHAARTPGLLCNGVSVGSYTGPSLGTKILCPLRYVGDNVSCDADVFSLHIFNRALTDSERAAVMRGEVPAALAKRVYSPPLASFAHAQGPGDISGVTATGFTLTGVTSPTAVYATAGTGSPDVTNGIKVRISLTSTAAGYAYLGDGSSGSSAFSIGANTFELTQNADQGPIIVFLDADGSVSNFTVEILGTIARYEPENVTSLGRWLDSSGNGYDLIPGSGITPLKPQPVQVREAWIKYDIGGSSPTVISNAGCIESCVKTVTGVFTATLNTFIPSANRVAATTHPFEVDPAYVQARGQGVVEQSFPRRYLLLTKNYTSDTTVDVSFTACVRWTE